MFSRIGKNDKLFSDLMLPIVLFFNRIANQSFVRTIGYLVEGRGVVIEYDGCYFSSDLEPDEEPFEGMLFSNGALKKEVLVDYSTALTYMEAASKAFVREFPDKRQILDELLRAFAKKHGVDYAGLLE